MKHTGYFFLAVVESILFWPLATLAVMGCFVIFDSLHIQALWLQIVVVESPFAVAAFFIWRRQARSQHQLHSLGVTELDTNESRS